MNALRTRAIVLNRIEYGEADRILTLLTPEYGKLRLMARGVRKLKSKLAGGIELFSTSDISFLRGKGEIGTLVSTRLATHYGAIVQDAGRLELGYACIKDLDKVTEDETEADYYNLLEAAFEALNDTTVDAGLVQVWFQAHLLALGGHSPNLQTDTNGEKLLAGQKYSFDFEAMTLILKPDGLLEAPTIKFLRLLFSQTNPGALKRVEGQADLAQSLLPLLQTMCRLQLGTVR